MQTTFTINTTGACLYEFTDDVAGSVAEEGIVTLCVQHNSAILLIQHNANAEVIGDLKEFFFIVFCHRPPIVQCLTFNTLMKAPMIRLCQKLLTPNSFINSCFKGAIAPWTLARQLSF